MNLLRWTHARCLCLCAILVAQESAKRGSYRHHNFPEPRPIGPGSTRAGKAFHEASFDALRNNKGLCGNATGLMHCVVVAASNNVGHRKSTKVIIFIVLSLFGLFFYSVSWLEVSQLHSRGYGAVYKAVLPIAEVVAVKKLHQYENNIISNNLKAFESEIHALSEIRRRNIVKLYGFCSHPKYFFFVYEFIERGSLRMVLRNKDEAMELDWERRLNVVKRVANAFNNVLLDLDYEAHVSDFGIAKLLKPVSSNWTSLAGTFGYIAPDNRVLVRYICCLTEHID
ncbi:MDIS1-interacting receptor like kinase 2-like [Durio zibethinus]|uniref:non-specific serine/threonine protein kinase n=1 Tax=Durio zibethinus TaxID=66656 RepID=A0A6P5ZIP6_DURZI|nr:MDIS1-interacting receptor like kinase 2-like [Durio zibethinus]